jgi:hypothetical protein
MKKMKNNNKFWAAHNELMDLCKNCQSNEKAKCDQVGNRCNNFEGKLTHLHYEKLCPFDPCQKCLVRPRCSSECEKYQRYFQVKQFVDNELRGHSTYYTKDKTPFITGPKHIISKEYLQSNEVYRKIIDFQFTESHIAAMKAEVFYPDLWNTLQQYREYVEYIKKNHLVNLF